MIDDSVPWKEDLLRIASRLHRRTTQVNWTERTSFLVERDVMVAAYAIRKLLEAHKLSDEISAIRVNARQHRLTGRVPDIWDRWEFWENYDLDQHATTQLTLRDFCNQVIHSWIFMLSATDEAAPLFDGVFVCSERERRQSVYFIEAGELIELFRAIGQDDILVLHTALNAEGERVITLASSRDNVAPPAPDPQILRDALVGFEKRRRQQ